MVCLSRPYRFKFSKGCLPQILLGAFLNTLTEMYLDMIYTYLGAVHMEVSWPGQAG